MIKDVPKTLVYALCAERNERAGRDLIPASMLDEAAERGAATRPEGQRFASRLRRARSDPRGLRRGRPRGRRPRRPRLRRRRSCAASPHWSIATSTSAGRRLPACGCRPRRSARIAGSRSPIAGPADAPTEELTVATRAPAAWETRRPLLPELALIVGHDHVRLHVQARAERVARTSLRSASCSSATVSPRSRSLRSHSATVGATARPGAERSNDSFRTFLWIGVAFGSDRLDGLLAPEHRPAAHDHLRLRLHHRAVRRVHPGVRDRDAPPVPEPARASRGRDRGGRPLPAHRRALRPRPRQRRSRSGARRSFGLWIYVGGRLANRFDAVALVCLEMVAFTVISLPVVVDRRARSRHRQGLARGARHRSDLLGGRVHAPALGPAPYRAGAGRGDPAVRAGRGRFRRLRGRRAARPEGLRRAPSSSSPASSSPRRRRGS